MTNAAFKTWDEWDGETWPHSNRLKTWQNGRCAMCGLEDRLVEDHCHRTGMVRGYLCTGCNVSEGSSDAVEWKAWRDWDTPARLLGYAVVYRSPIGGGTSLNFSTDLQYFSDAEKEAYWDEAIRRAAVGEAWPQPMVLSSEAAARKRQADTDLDLIAAAVAR